MTKYKNLLEEAVKSWESEIKQLNHEAEWIREEAKSSTVIRISIKHKKELIENAKILLKEIA